MRPKHEIQDEIDLIFSELDKVKTHLDDQLAAAQHTATRRLNAIYALATSLSDEVSSPRVAPIKSNHLRVVR
ncbi:hypothetical protein [uncultured Umboniibacter sp.]|uniref:hypothetical protein n=1 Tax=uncultured Umboniibacter sp. TaxID=1798917 RepID=UPI0026169122|nr:hypothetical protein [uncultured Umboniibacter sp.]